MKNLFLPLLCQLLALTVLTAGPVLAVDNKNVEVKIGYFQNWPLPSQFSRIKNTYDAIMGVSVYWVPFDNNERMVDALDSGDIQIGYSVSMASFIGGLNREAELAMVGVAVTYPDHYPCVLHNDFEISSDSMTRLEGQTVAIQSTGVGLAKLVTVLEQYGVDISQLKTIGMQDAAEMNAALRQGEVIMACADAAILSEVKPQGRPLKDVLESAAAEPVLYDAIVVSGSFMRDHADLLQSFMDITEATNAQWRDDPDPMRAAIARGAALNPVSAENAMSGLGFPSAAEQKTEAWLGDVVASDARTLAEFLLQQGAIDAALDDYSPFIATRFLR